MLSNGQGLGGTTMVQGGIKSCRGKGVCTDTSLQKSKKERILMSTEYLSFEILK